MLKGEWIKMRKPDKTVKGHIGLLRKLITGVD